MDHDSQHLESQQNETNGEPLYVVFDIPVSTTAEEAARLINEPYERGFYIHSVSPWLGHGGVGARVFAKRITHPRTAKPFSSEAPATKEARATQFLRDNREMTVKQLYAAFKAIGVVRSEAWIGKKRVEIIRTDRRVV